MITLGFVFLEYAPEDMGVYAPGEDTEFPPIVHYNGDEDYGSRVFRCFDDAVDAMYEFIEKYGDGADVQYGWMFDPTHWVDSEGIPTVCRVIPITIGE